MDGLELGFCQTDITPRTPMHTIGFGSSDLSHGIERPLCAQVAIWSLGAVKCCLVAIDHIGFGIRHAQKLRGEIGALLGILPENVMLCFSHTHSAPNDSIEVEYANEVDARVLNAAQAAASHMLPVRAAWGNGRVDIGVNRRANDALDGRAGILKAASMDGAPALMLVRLTAHANSLKADNKLISPDYFGATRDMLRAEFGCPVMLTQGASGDIAPKYFCSILNPPDADDSGRYVRSDTALDDMARAVTRGVRAVWSAIEPREVERLDAHVRQLTLAADVPTDERAREIAREAHDCAGIDAKAWLSEIARLHDEGVARQFEQVEIQYLGIGEGTLCGVPNELMCEYALMASARLADAKFYLGGYTNGCTGYFPTAREYDAGGYEVFWSMLDYFIYHGRVMPLNRDSEFAFLNAVVAGARPPISAECAAFH